MFTQITPPCTYRVRFLPNFYCDLAEIAAQEYGLLFQAEFCSASKNCFRRRVPTSWVKKVVGITLTESVNYTK